MTTPISASGRCALLLVLVVPALLAAEPTIAPIFGAGMVVQRDRPIPVWGTADDGTAVVVALGTDRVTAVAAAGRWEVALPARPASAEPMTLTISLAGQERTFTDVLVGEVWLCSGQSNMAGTVAARPPREIADLPLVRAYGKPRGGGKDGPSWMTAVGEAKMHFSAVGIYFGENLHRELQVPVGLIQAAVSGTPIEQWTPLAELEGDAAVKAVLDRLKDRDLLTRINEERTRLREAQKAGKEAQPAADLDLPMALTDAGRLHKLHVEPTAPYAIRGVIWYQGEANAKFAANAQRYGGYLRLLIAGLRRVYRDADLPFYLVQLPSIDTDNTGRTDLVYHLVRQQQLETVRSIPKTGLAVAIDLDEGLHPHSKHIVGDRLARLALHEVYGEDVGAVSGPLFRAATFAAGKATCTFDHAAGLHLADGVESLCEIAGADGVFHPAEAVVEGEHLIVSNPVVPKPTAVRYAFRGQMPKVSLFGADGLPASPFASP